MGLRKRSFRWAKGALLGGERASLGGQKGLFFWARGMDGVDEGGGGCSPLPYPGIRTEDDGWGDI